MGFTTPNLPAVDHEAFVRLPLRDRLQILVLKWVDYGYGVPRMIHVLYIAKLVVFYAVVGIAIATATSGLPSFWHVSEWWNQPIVYQKAILWTVLLEALGLGGSWGPLAGKTKPMTGGYRFWARPNTIRLRPWRRVPLTARQPKNLVRHRAVRRAARQPGGAAAAAGRAQRVHCRRRCRPTPPVW